jgi:hypothetical protein
MYIRSCTLSSKWVSITRKSKFSGFPDKKLKKLEFNFVFLKAGGFNVQLWVYSGDWRRFLKAKDLASLPYATSFLTNMFI